MNELKLMGEVLSVELTASEASCVAGGEDGSEICYITSYECVSGSNWCTALLDCEE